MAHWKDAAVTNDGVEMLNEWMAGRKITVVAAYGGTGTVAPELLAEQTDLVDTRQELHILGEEDGADGKTIQVQVHNAKVLTEYELNQVGVYAALDVDKDPDAPRRLLFIMQDEKGVTIPAASEASFLLELYCMIGITNNGRFDVSVSTAGVVTATYMREALKKAVAAHNGDKTAHQDIREALASAAADGEDLGSNLAGLDARLELLELMYRTQVNGNPFTVSFSDMSGLEVTGVWNETLKRVEF